MAHTNKKKEEIKAKRGATFEGFRPRVEETKKGRLEKSDKKHRIDYRYCY